MVLTLKANNSDPVINSLYNFTPLLLSPIIARPSLHARRLGAGEERTIFFYKVDAPLEPSSSGNHLAGQHRHAWAFFEAGISFRFPAWTLYEDGSKLTMLHQLPVPPGNKS
jgi:hypothetical protein